MSEVKRRLATILATDCVDFSKHMESQEEKTLSSLKECRDIIDPIINKFSGRIFHTAGDSIIAEFDSPVGATKAGVEFQKSIKDITDVIILAGIVGDPLSKKYPRESVEINYEGIKSCLNFFKNKNRLIIL